MDTIRIPQRIVDGDFAGWLRAAMKSRRMSARMTLAPSRSSTGPVGAFERFAHRDGIQRPLP